MGGPLSLKLERFVDHKFRPTGGKASYYTKKNPPKSFDLNGTDGFELTVLGQPLDIMGNIGCSAPGDVLHTNVPLARIHRPYIMRPKDPKTFAQGKFKDYTRGYGSDQGDLALVYSNKMVFDVSTGTSKPEETWYFDKIGGLSTRFGGRYVLKMEDVFSSPWH